MEKSDGYSNLGLPNSLSLEQVESLGVSRDDIFLFPGAGEPVGDEIIDDFAKWLAAKLKEN